MTFNPCYTKTASCSACCGLHNMKSNALEKKEWLAFNTRDFLKLNLENRATVLKFRHSGEEILSTKMIRPDVYICPFLGITDYDNFKTGCLLHEEGSPHPQIGLLLKPQSLSFYGETICKTYNCIAKQNLGHYILKASALTTSDSYTYGKIVANHNLLKICRKLITLYPDNSEPIVKVITEAFSLYEVPITSFEMPLTLHFFDQENLWHVLGMQFIEEGYYFDSFRIFESGINIGNNLKHKIGV